MSLTTKTGLTASPTKKVPRYTQKNDIQLFTVARKAPFVLKPYAGLYNPYSYGCSLLCNHPTDNEAKEVIKKAKDNWAADNKNVLLAEEIEAIRTGLQSIPLNKKVLTPRSIVIPAVESVPEELFRRYTETDSRPLTPAPTVVSAVTKASGSRRCVTPDPILTNEAKEKTLLILDLRRSHSQETLSWYGASSLEPPLIKIQHVPTRTASLEDLQENLKQTLTPRRPRSRKKEKPEDVKETEAEKNEEALEEDDEYIKRRGKRRKKKARDASIGTAFRTSIDPETQVATIGTDSGFNTARQSLEPGTESLPEIPSKRKPKLRVTKSLEVDSFLDAEILKQLRRELNEEVVDNELNYKRRVALEEALKTITKDKSECEELKAIQDELKLPPVNAELWMALPRLFSRSSAIFELPMNSSTLSKLTPLDYVKNHITITSGRKLLYNCVFNKFKEENDLEIEHERKLSGKKMQEALDLMMGTPMTKNQADYIKRLLCWKEEDFYDFKTFCGISALCERLLAPQYCSQLPSREEDPCREVETADFEALTRKLHGQNANPQLIEILYGIKEF